MALSPIAVDLQNRIQFPVDIDENALLAHSGHQMRILLNLSRGTIRRLHKLEYDLVSSRGVIRCSGERLRWLRSVPEVGSITGLTLPSN